MGQASTAKSETDKANAKELVEVAVASSYSMSTGKLDAEKVRAKLEEAGATTSGTEFPMIVRTANGYTFEIQNGGKIVTTSGVTLSPTKLKMFANRTEDIMATLSEELSEELIVWETTDDTIATVEGSGTNNSIGTVETKGVDAGSSCQIVAIGGRESARCNVTVVNTVSSIEAEQITLLESQTSRINFKESWKIEDVIYSAGSTGPGLISISDKGNIRGVDSGISSVKLTGEKSNESIEIGVRIVKSVHNLTVSPITIETLGQTSTITIELSTYEPVVVSSLNNYIASINTVTNEESQMQTITITANNNGVTSIALTGSLSRTTKTIQVTSGTGYEPIVTSTVTPGPTVADNSGIKVYTSIPEPYWSNTSARIRCIHRLAKWDKYRNKTI